MSGLISVMMQDILIKIIASKYSSEFSAHYSFITRVTQADCQLFAGFSLETLKT